MHEVPRAQLPLLAFDDQNCFARDDEEALLIGLSAQTSGSCELRRSISRSSEASRRRAALPLDRVARGDGGAKPPESADRYVSAVGRPRQHMRHHSPEGESLRRIAYGVHERRVPGAALANVTDDGRELLSRAFEAFAQLGKRAATAVWGFAAGDRRCPDFFGGDKPFE